MDVAFASKASGGGGFGAFIPLLIIGLFSAFLFRSIAKRKGRSQWLWFLAGFVPLFGWVGGIWLASLNDKLFEEDVRALVTALKKFDFVPTGTAPSSAQKTWQCNCGKICKLDESNCPECGLKRDFVLQRRFSQ